MDSNIQRIEEDEIDIRENFFYDLPLQSNDHSFCVSSSDCKQLYRPF